MFNDFKLTKERPVYLQIKDYLKHMITKGALQANQKLPSTREVSTMLGVSRTTVVTAYADLEEEGLVYTMKGKGHFVTETNRAVAAPWRTNWTERLSSMTLAADALDHMKHGVRMKRGMIAFTSIAPDEHLFDLKNFKRAFLERLTMEGEIILNYGYAKGYKPLIDYLMKYMENKGVDLTDKDMLITNGFTEAFDIACSALKKENGRVISENPTHNTALKILKLHGFEVTGIELEQDGIDLQMLDQALTEKAYDFAYLIPSYHNPTGIVMSAEKRIQTLKRFADHQIPIIEDGFNEELRFSGAHVAPLIACNGTGNSVIYLGSFSKILFPGLRIGWILADKTLINYLESVKRSRTIHTSTLDQAILFQYLHDGYFEKYMKKARAIYKKKYELAVHYCQKYIPFAEMTGDGGLHLFLKFPKRIDTHTVLEACYERGVVFTPGTRFFTNHDGRHTLRLGFSRVSDEDIAKGVQIIGDVVHHMMKEC
ncbi:PLP-dependent aminotransferase family protein [Camelliibacillus cellulosilyticus]|uniref:PLP-dependent aminotransferase family protein n=1 Tax=Camelliibacillus cellulosilyticus TaxID=2174486 RepID=A0ABV9GME6_9BACL